MASLCLPILRCTVSRKCWSARNMGSASVGRVGFIGLGNMGANMAGNLLKNFKDVTVYDISQDNVDKLVGQGAKKAANVETLASQCDVIVTMVPATQHVMSLMHGPGGILANARKGTIIIDSSTIDPLASSALSKDAIAAGLHMLDCPVSGGVTGAAAGTLTFMAGGDPEILQRIQPVLESMGKRIVHCGPAGSGGVAKLCNNMSLAIAMIGTSEAMALGVKLGMDPVVLAGILNTSTARCWSSDSYNPVPGVMAGVPSSRGYSGGFGTALMEKDLALAADAANSVKARIPLGSAAMQLYGLMVEHGYAQKDFSVVYEFLTTAAKK